MIAKPSLKLKKNKKGVNPFLASADISSQYIGRFAPSPTGDLHLGSLYTAVASYLDAKAHNGQWLIRIEDIDETRAIKGAADSIINCLRTHGRVSDGPIIMQSERKARYEEVLDQLANKERCFYCHCSRKDLAGEIHYPGHCRDNLSPHPGTAIKIRVERGELLPFVDDLLGKQSPPEAKTGFSDFVIKRRDKYFAYQLACVVDDIDQGITHVVRGQDILDSTFKQRFLYKLLNTEPPHYTHLPLIKNQQGQKLSKQNLAPSINPETPTENLISVLEQLKQPLPPKPKTITPRQLLDFSIAHWSLSPSNFYKK